VRGVYDCTRELKRRELRVKSEATRGFDLTVRGKCESREAVVEGLI
jgi:hypothetical protein